MDQNLPIPGPELPRPEKAPAKIDGAELVVPVPEQLEQAAPGERLNKANDAVAQASSTTTSVNDLALQAVQTPTPTPVAKDDDNPAIADDVDVIEKEWVEKAKEIVTQTKTDPHKQSLELTKFKHDYMSKRYGKNIKLSDEQAA
ncbi:MAG: hypothetical protein M0R39_17860 [Prolixibacteraceae bacterium]|nr:hypothetical protein [Prolixibacteraceae bacterium]